MVSHGCALVAKAIESEETLGCDPTHEEPTEEETNRIQYDTVDKQESAEFGLIIAREKSVTAADPKS